MNPIRQWNWRTARSGNVTLSLVVMVYFPFSQPHTARHNRWTFRHTVEDQEAVFPNEDMEPLVTKACVFQLRIPRSEMEKDARTLEIYNDLTFRVWMGPGRSVIADTMPKREQWIAAFCDYTHGSLNEVGAWIQPGDIDYVRRRLDVFDPALRACLVKAQGCTKWRIAEGPALARWTSQNGRIVLLGDAAHAMLPSAGQVSLASSQ